MFQIGICDDEAGSRALLAGYARTLIQHQGLNFRLQEYASAEALLSAQDKPEILLLDVQMGGMDGVMAAKTLREQGCGSIIILVTNYIQYAIDGYEFNAFYFLKKPVEYERFCRVVGQAMRLVYRNAHATLAVKCEEGLRQLTVRTISYCETDRGGVLLHLPGETVRCRRGIAQLEQQLQTEDFFRCHTAYLVNLAEIERIGAADLTLKDGTVLPVSKHRKKAFREAVAAFWGKDYA